MRNKRGGYQQQRQTRGGDDLPPREGGPRERDEMRAGEDRRSGDSGREGDQGGFRNDNRQQRGGGGGGRNRGRGGFGNWRRPARGSRRRVT